MIGIHCAFEGRLGNDAELRYLATGNAMLSFSAAVEQPPKGGQPTPSEWVKVVLFGDDAEGLAERLTKGALVYCEGRVNLNKWTDREGKEHAGLNVVATLVQPMGQIGRRAPQNARRPARPTGEIHDGRGVRQPVPAGADGDHYGGLPF